MRVLLRAIVTVIILVVAASPVAAQNSDDLKVAIYPLLGWAPVFGAEVRSIPDLPGGGGGGGGGTGGGSTSGGLIDTTLNGALMFGLAVDTGPWRLEADGMWAALYGDRPERPFLEVDLDVIYGHAAASLRIYKKLYVSGGVRRLALNYDIELEGLSARFTNKPGFWDPLIGIAWHHLGETLEVHAGIDANVFGTGADKDIGGGIRFDWKPIPHFGLAFGYAGIDLKISKTVLGQPFAVEQTLHGPVVGFGLYF